MSVITFSTEQVAALNANPYVDKVTSKRVEYSEAFKKLFIDRYRLGVQPRDIFKDAGFDVEALGYKRIERAADRWRKMNNEGRLGDEIDYVAVHESRQRQRTSLIETIEQQNEIILNLEEENSLLKERVRMLEGA